MFLHIVRKADIFNNYFGCKKREFFPTCFFTVTIIPTRVYYIKKNNFLRFTFRSGNNSINETHRWRFLCGFCLTCRDSARDNIESKSNGSTAVHSQWSFVEPFNFLASIWNTYGAFLQENLRLDSYIRNGFCVSLLNRSIQDPLDHYASKEPKNPCPEWILWFLWRTMIREILDWSFHKRNAKSVYVFFRI